ncbi:MAG: glucuronate isomerase [Candidatus Brocadiaceae bacterium]|jgi:glucuronate isomerase
MSPSEDLEQRLLREIERIPVIDVHSHVPAAEPFARSLRELLGYHYYTELAHSAGMSQEVIDPQKPDGEVIPALLKAMANIDNTAQYRWLMELAEELFGFEERKLTEENWEPLADRVSRAARRPDRAREILRASGIEKVFLTNSFEEDLDEIDMDIFVPSLRADSLVFGLGDSGVREALQQVSGVELRDAGSLRDALGAVVERFAVGGARSAAISLPPGFQTYPPAGAHFAHVVQRAFKGPLSPEEAEILQSGVLFGLMRHCRDCGLPFQIMYGVVRDAYRHGVPQGTDLPAAGDTLRGLLPLVNAFPEVTFCLSVLSSSQVQELAAYGWIIRNVVLSGHWWYLNVPRHIASDLSARIQSVPKTKLIGYYSDMYKLEFGLAKFNMYRRVLARVLAGDFVEVGLGSEEDAVQIARLLLRDNARRIFGL